PYSCRRLLSQRAVTSHVQAPFSGPAPIFGAACFVGTASFPCAGCFPCAACFPCAVCFVGAVCFAGAGVFARAGVHACASGPGVFFCVGGFLGVGCSWTAPAMLEAGSLGSQPARAAVPRDRWNASSYSRGGTFPQ